MIKFEHTQVFNFEGAFRGARNPMNSWHLSDSYCTEDGEFRIGEKDMDLAKRLIKGGTDHRKFLRQIIVSVDITAPRYWWPEFDTYKISTVANSCSTMHKIHERELTIDDFSLEQCDELTRNVYEKHIIPTFNYFRNLYNEADKKLKREDLTKAERKHVTAQRKYYWKQLILLLSQSYNQKRTVTMNYENLRNMYHGRQNHKLDEWSVGFMEWIDSLPYADELIKC